MVRVIIRSTIQTALGYSLLLGAVPALAADDGTPTPQKIGYTPLKVPNACLPDAVGFKAAYEVYTRHVRPLNGVGCCLYIRQRRTASARMRTAYLPWETGLRRTIRSPDVHGGRCLDLTDKNDAGKLGRVLGAHGFVRAAWADQTL